MDPSPWVPALITVAAGLAVGGVLVSTLKGRGSSSPGTAALWARKDALLEQLRALDADRHKLTEQAYQAERGVMIAEAASVLRQLEELGEDRSPPAGAWPLGVALTVAVAVLCVVAVFSWPDGEEEPVAATSSGHVRPPQGEGGGAPLPDDLDSLNALVYQAILDGDLQAAMQAHSRAKALGPDDPYVLTHTGALRVAVGLNARAEEALEQVLSTHPDFPRALLWSGIARGTQGDAAGAVAYFERTLAVAPDSTEAAEARLLLAELAQRGEPATTDEPATTEESGVSTEPTTSP